MFETTLVTSVNIVTKVANMWQAFIMIMINYNFNRGLKLIILI